jgi:hypothetical protein
MSETEAQHAYHVAGNIALRWSQSHYFGCGVSRA